MNELPFSTRIWFAWVAFFKILFDGRFAAQVYEPKQIEAPKAEEPKKEEPKKEEPKPKKVEAPKPSNDPALQLLALLQREGRLVDFLEEDIAGAADDQIGAAARVVHQGCRKALREHVKLAAVREEEEGAKISLPEGFDPSHVKLTGNVTGKGPHEGTLRHKGWKVTEIKLPTPVDGHDARVIAQAEVEL